MSEGTAGITNKGFGTLHMKVQYNTRHLGVKLLNTTMYYYVRVKFGKNCVLLFKKQNEIYNVNK
jgi:hypothetical protein